MKKIPLYFLTYSPIKLIWFNKGRRAREREWRGERLRRTREGGRKNKELHC